MSSPIIELKNISKRFSNIQALDNVGFDLYPGEIHALVGENGAGKSTLMHILAGIYNTYDGEYFLDGESIRLQDPKDALRRGIGMIHQELSVIPSLSVAENLFLGRQPKTRWGTVDWRQMYRVAAEELDRVGFSYIDVHLPLEHYPLGIQQVVEVLRVIFSGARILIMDEPTSALSPAEVDRLMELINTLRQQQRSIVYISHFLEEVLQVADRITVLRDGRSVATLKRDEADRDQLISLILGREINARLPAAIKQTEEHVLLDIKNLNADNFSDINLQLRTEEIIGLYGPVGAGHFDVARAIFGLYRVDSGTIAVEGKPFPANHTAAYAIRKGIAYVTETRRKSLFLEDAIYKNITLPHLTRISPFSPNQIKEVNTAQVVIEQVNVQPPDPLNAVGRLSGGNQQKVAIARWLTFPPKVFIVSEPTRGMDVGAKNDVLSILRNLRNQGYGVLIVSSEPETILSVSDQVITMSRGRITAHLENKELDKDTLMRLL
ncbi:MAG: sugar ABC transporter ATP-binding protein [Chitinophagaceae bacterium]|nr:sugar ABC transporter ATP-binding protein [Anaerolineae bacterium]